MKQVKDMTFLEVMKAFEWRVGGTLENDIRAGHYTKDVVSIRKPDPEIFLQVGLDLGMEKQGEDLWPLRGFSEQHHYFLQYRDSDGYLIGVVLNIDYKASISGVGTISLGMAE